MTVESIHELFKRVQEHPDFRFGTIFVTDDMEGFPGWSSFDHRKYAEEHITAAGFEYLENEAT
jgi:hypothetical protein